MFEVFSSPEAWIALLTLTLLEIVLGIDNIIFISIITGKLPEAQRPRTRTIGLMMAMLFRLGLLSLLGFILQLNEPLFELPFAWPGAGNAAHEGVAANGGIGISVKDLLLFAGGLFLLGKSVSEIHAKIEGVGHGKEGNAPVSVRAVILQIVMVDIVFSFDSILTAVGLTDHVPVMMIAVVISVIVMMIFSGPIANFIHRHPTFQILALSFLILIGFTLIIEGLHVHVSKGYIYFAVAFAFGIEVVNMRIRKKTLPADGQ